MNDAERTFRQKTMPEPLTGLDAELYAALAECGRIIEEMPHDERRERVDAFLETHTADRNFLVGVMLVAHQRRIFDQQWEQQATMTTSPHQPAIDILQSFKTELPLTHPDRVGVIRSIEVLRSERS